MTRYSFTILFALPLVMSVACQSSSSPVDTKRHAVAAGGTPATAAQNNKEVSGQAPSLPEADQQMLDQLNRQEPRFKNHYDHYYADSGYGYNQYRPAYQYGFELAMDGRYKSMDWTLLELQARKGWDERTMGLWDQYKDAVRFGWERGVIAQRG
ncbi:MAG: hypothetical protein NW701_13285 [Nitrospira sp.]